MREDEKHRRVFDMVQKGNGRATPLVALPDSSAKWVGFHPMLERRWVLRGDFSDVAVREPEIFNDIGGVSSADSLIAVRDMCGVAKDWVHACSVMQSDKPQFWTASAYLLVMLILEASMKEDSFRVMGSGPNHNNK